MHRSTAMVVVAFVASGDMRILLKELVREPSPPRQWIGSESWVTDPDLLSFSICAGAIGFGIQQSVIPGLREFLLDLPLTKVAASPLLTEFWEDAFNCRLGEGKEVVLRFGDICNGVHWTVPSSVAALGSNLRFYVRGNLRLLKNNMKCTYSVSL